MRVPISYKYTVLYRDYPWYLFMQSVDLLTHFLVGPAQEGVRGEIVSAAEAGGTNREEARGT